MRHGSCSLDRRSDCILCEIQCFLVLRLQHPGGSSVLIILVVGSNFPLGLNGGRVVVDASSWRQVLGWGGEDIFGCLGVVDLNTMRTQMAEKLSLLRDSMPVFNRNRDGVRNGFGDWSFDL